MSGAPFTASLQEGYYLGFDPDTQLAKWGCYMQGILTEEEGFLQ